MQAQHPHPITQFFSINHPLAKYLAFDFGECSGGDVEVFSIAANEFVEDETTGTLHTGYATIVLDSILGGAVFGALTTPVPIATVGLSVNHLRRPSAGEKLVTKAHVRGIYNDLAYVTGSMESLELNDLVASASGTFMIGTRGTSIRGKTDQSRP